jgi:hypothetical protein
MAIMKDMLGYECKLMKLEDTEEQYKELDRKFKAFAAKYKQEVKRSILLERGEHPEMDT